MAGSGSTRATVYNRAGVGVRRMEATRWFAACFFLIILFAGIYFFNRSVKTIATLGILAVETKSHKGVVSCEGEMLKRDGQPFEKDLLKQAWAQAFSIRDLLASHGITAPKPQPVILFADADVQVRKQVRGVEIIGRRDLPLYLKRLQNRLSANEAEKIFEILKLSQSQLFV